MDAPGDILYGKSLVPRIIDEIATRDPERVCFSYPRTANLQDSFRDLNFRTVSGENPFDGCHEQQLIVPSLPPPSTKQHISFRGKLGEAQCLRLSCTWATQT